MKIGCNYSGRTADTGSAMNVHSMSLTQQMCQRGDALGKTYLQVGIAEVLDRNAFEREPHPSRRRPFRLDSAITSVLFILKAENSSDVQRLQVLEILVVVGIWPDPQIGLDRRAGHPQDDTAACSHVLVRQLSAAEIQVTLPTGSFSAMAIFQQPTAVRVREWPRIKI